MKIIRPIAAAILLASLTACGSGAGGQIVTVTEVTRPNGQTVECANTNRGGIDCNWDAAR